MTNLERIRKMEAEELAELLVRAEDVNEVDEGIDGEWEDFYVTHFIVPDGFYSYDYDDAVAYTIDWLNADIRGDAE